MAILPKFVGARIKRREDPALIQGLGQYVDDIPMAGTLHAAFLRSPYAHARITDLHVAAAWQYPGVVAVLTGYDILGKVGTIPCVAESPSTAQDAVDLIEMDVELLPVVVDPEQAAQPGASKVHDDFDDAGSVRRSSYRQVWGGWESCSIRIEPTGMVTVRTGASPPGQGSETTYAQLVADTLGVPLDHIEVVHGNTDVVPYGIGTFGSRSLAVGGAALQMSVEKIKDKARQLAAYILGVRPEDVTYGDGAIYVTADPSRKKTLAEVAFAATDFNWQLQGGAPAGLEPGLEATSRFEPANGTFPFGTHICVVEVERKTGAVELKRYVAVDDCGNVINPLIVDGQVHGGITQGLAQALYEEVVYDAHGHLVTGSLMDYAVPKAPRLPTIETAHTVTPTLLNPLGAKGIGEAGTIGSAPAVANAIIDALAPFGVTHLEMPFKPEKLWRLMHQGTQA